MSEDTTTSTARRWPFTNDVLAGLLVVSTVGAVGFSLSATGSIPETLTWVFAVESLLAATWAFGRETLSAVSKVLPSNGGGSGEPAVRRELAESKRDSGSEGT
jgi:hypothetical protein